MKKPLIIAIIVIVVALIGGTVAWKVMRPLDTKNTVTVGAVLPLSGPAAFLGEVTLNGLYLAQEHANSGKWGNLPYTIRIVPEDGAAVPKTSISAYRKLTDVDKVRAVVTMSSGVCMALKPIAEQEGVLLFANATHPNITDNAAFTLRHSQTAGQEAKAIIDSVLERRLANGVAVIYENDDYGVAFAREVRASLERASVKQLAELPYERASIDARILAQKALEENPDAVIVLGVGKDLGLVIRRLREYGFAGQIYTGLGFIVISGAVEAAGEYAHGVHYTQFNFDVNSSAYKSLAEDYQARFGKEMGAVAVIGYNTIKLLCAVMGDAPLDPKMVADRIRGMTEFSGAGEQVLVTPGGDLMPAIRLLTF